MAGPRAKREPRLPTANRPAPSARSVAEAALALPENNPVRLHLWSERKVALWMRQLLARQDFDALVTTGLSKRDAARKVAERFGCCQRTVWNWLPFTEPVAANDEASLPSTNGNVAA